MKYPLVPLRIPSGWIVGKNGFYDVEPIVSSGLFKNADLFSEDMLFLRRDVPAHWEDQYIVDLGWIPSRDPAGIYRLTLVIGSWDRVVRQFESRDRYEIQRTIDRWLDVLSSHSAVADALEALEKL